MKDNGIMKKKKEPEHVSIELRCSRSSDGKYNASTYLNGTHAKDHAVNVIRGDEFSVVLLYRTLKEKYPAATIQVKGLDRHGMDSILRSAAPQ
jgi:hypothetical protein